MLISICLLSGYRKYLQLLLIVNVVWKKEVEEDTIKVGWSSGNALCESM